MFLIVGLGNPGDKYERNMHNMGFMTLDRVMQKLNKSIKKKECNAKTLITSVGGNEVVFALPQTFMNLSGESVKSLMSKYKVKPEELLVIYDDIDIEKGLLRFRKQGSGGTHNGMRNIIQCIGSTNFNRLRVGVSKPEYNLIDYVLSNIKKDDEALFEDVFDKASDIVIDFAKGKSIDAIMNDCNSYHYDK